MVLRMESQDLPHSRQVFQCWGTAPAPHKSTVLGVTGMGQWEKVLVAKSEEVSSIPRIYIIKNQLHNVVPLSSAHIPWQTYTHTNEIPVSKPMTDTLLNYTPSSQITLFKEPVQVILWFYKQSERRWTRKQSQHVTFFTTNAGPETLWCLECVPASAPPQRCLAQLADTICVSEGLHLCLLFWKLTLGDPQSLQCVLGRLPRVCVYLPDPVNLYTTDPVRNTHTLWRSKSYKFMVLWTQTTSGRDDVETELWEEVRLGRATDTEAMTRGHKVKWLNTICNSTCKWNDVSSTLESTPCLLFFLLYNQADQSQTHQDYCLPQAISCPLSEQITAKVP